MKIMSGVFVKRSIIGIAIAGIALFLVYNNFGIYRTPIAKVLKVQNSNNSQVLQVEMKNGPTVGGKLRIDNKYESSRAYGEKYYRGDILFLNKDCSRAIGVKRDYIIAGLFAALLAALCIFGSLKGVLTAVCLIANLLIFIGAVFLHISGHSILLSAALSSVIFTFTVLALVSGIRKRTFAAFAAVLLTASLIAAVAAVLIWNSDIDYDFLHFMPEPFTTVRARQFFLSQTVIGCLGAVIDVCVTVTAAGTEIIRTTGNISWRNFIASIRNISDDITGTMVNVILLTNIAPTLPIFLISMANDVRFGTVMSHDAYFYIARSLAGMCSIFIAIFVSIIITSLVMRSEVRND